MARMVAQGRWITKEDFLAGEIGGAKKARVILKDSDLNVIDSSQLPTYETIHGSIPERVVLQFDGKEYWTFEWTFQKACEKSKA